MMSLPGDVDDLMISARRLAGTKFSLFKDYPKEITDARKQLWPRFKEAMSKHGPRNIQTLFPAALRVNGRIVEDLFPEWHTILKGSRLTNVHERIHNSVASSVEIFRQSVKHTTSQPARFARNSPTSDSNKPPKQIADEFAKQEPVDLTLKQDSTAFTKSRSAPTSP
ncbi:hypothetical protein DPMN_089685 [Dreissena polymorpha]|uniref:Uncharacterized protein n=1 Tax=Dreissena polymorpha TaxID=45954 RepID=A0A9D4QZ47_DREPO|nr:hypothetical protein DPMN_089685 [Dreissena polymorpha]